MKKFCLFILLFLFANFVNAESLYSEYSNPENWLSKPSEIKYPVDIFYIYPTVCMQSENGYCLKNNQSMKSAAQLVFKRQALAFDTVGNIFSPYYTQLDLNELTKSKNYTQTQQMIKNNKYELKDIYNSLDYYFQNINQNRPYILVSHSQGSSVMLFVLSEYMKQNPNYYKNMIAAYVIGFSVTKDYMKENPHLKFAKKHNDTGVIISYNTQSPNKIGPNLVHTENQLVINPISWTRSEKLAKRNKNLGSIDENTFEITTPGIANAKVDKKQGVVICSSVDEKKYEIPFKDLFGNGSYHGQDFQFYYLNLRQNAKDRVNAFLKKK